MTVEITRIADLGDIAAIRLACRKCGAALVWSPAQPGDRLPFGCSACRAAWFSDTTPSLERDTIHAFLVAFAAMVKLPTSPTYAVRLELPEAH